MILLKKVDSPFVMVVSQIDIPNTFKTCFTCHYCPEALMKKFVQLNCIVIGLKVLDDGPIFFGIVCRQERGGFICKYRWKEDAKTKVYKSVYKIFTNSVFKSYRAIVIWRFFLPKWSLCKVKSLFLIFNSLAINAIILYPRLSHQKMKKNQRNS